MPSGVQVRGIGILAEVGNLAVGDVRPHGVSVVGLREAGAERIGRGFDRLAPCGSGDILQRRQAAAVTRKVDRER